MEKSFSFAGRDVFIFAEDAEYVSTLIGVVARFSDHPAPRFVVAMSSLLSQLLRRQPLSTTALRRLPRVPPPTRYTIVRPQLRDMASQFRAMGSVSAIDSAIFRTLFGTEEIREVCLIYPALKQLRGYMETNVDVIGYRCSMIQHTSPVASTPRPLWRAHSQNAA